MIKKLFFVLIYASFMSIARAEEPVCDIKKHLENLPCEEKCIQILGQIRLTAENIDGCKLSCAIIKLKEIWAMVNERNIMLDLSCPFNRLVAPGDIITQEQRSWLIGENVFNPFNGKLLTAREVNQYLIVGGCVKSQPKDLNE